MAVYPLNSKYLSREIKDQLSPGILSDVPLAPGLDGKEGGSYRFAGNIGSYIEFPNNGRLDVKHSITILCWVYPQTTDGPLFQPAVPITGVFSCGLVEEVCLLCSHVGTTIPQGICFTVL